MVQLKSSETMILFLQEVSSEKTRKLPNMVTCFQTFNQNQAAVPDLQSELDNGTMSAARIGLWYQVLDPSSAGEEEGKKKKKQRGGSPIAVALKELMSQTLTIGSSKTLPSIKSPW